MIPEPVTVSVSVFLPLRTPDTGTFAVVSLEPVPTWVPAPTLEKLPLHFVKPELNMCETYLAMPVRVQTFLLTLPVVFGLHDSFSYYTDCANSNAVAGTHGTTGTGNGTFNHFKTSVQVPKILVSPHP